MPELAPPRRAPRRAAAATPRRGRPAPCRRRRPPPRTRPGTPRWCGPGRRRGCGPARGRRARRGCRPAARADEQLQFVDEDRGERLHALDRDALGDRSSISASSGCSASSVAARWRTVVGEQQLPAGRRPQAVLGDLQRCAGRRPRSSGSPRPSSPQNSTRSGCSSVGGKTSRMPPRTANSPRFSTRSTRAYAAATRRSTTSLEFTVGVAGAQRDRLEVAEPRDLRLQHRADRRDDDRRRAGGRVVGGRVAPAGAAPPAGGRRCPPAARAARAAASPRPGRRATVSGASRQRSAAARSSASRGVPSRRAPCGPCRRRTRRWRTLARSAGRSTSATARRRSRSSSAAKVRRRQVPGVRTRS